MRSIGTTLLLTGIAAVLCAVAAWQWREGNFDSLFGAQPTAVGQAVYHSFHPGDVKHIRITSDGNTASFSLLDGGWQASSPWQDRMDPRAAVGIINFTLGLRVEDFAAVDEVDPEKSGLTDKAVTIRLEDAGHRPLARYRLGRATPWKAEVEGIEQPVTTVYIHPRDRHRRNHVYACTGDINPLFKDGLRFLRDHRPFYFNPVALQSIRIRSQQGDLLLGRASPDSPWRIVKPLDLATDPAAIKLLIEGLYELQAARVSDRLDTTPPETGDVVKTSQIAIQSFGSDQETVLEILPADPPDAEVVMATVSDRPGSVFELPVKPEPGLITLANLPLAVNDLRDPRLTHLNIQSLRGISIQPSTGSEILITREPPEPWTATSEGLSFEASEENLYSLLKSVTTTRAIGFESDAATDLSPWGLDRPILKLRFLGQDNQALELNFGLDGKGGYFVNRLGTPSVMRVDESLLASIAVRPYEWMHSRLWSIDRTNLLSIKLSRGEEPPTILKYNFDYESWQVERDGKDLSAALEPARANYLLSVIEGLKVSRWLSPTDEGALAALKNPSLSITVTEFTVDGEFETTGVIDRVVVLAPGGPGANPGFYYGRLDDAANPFLIDSATYQNLGIDLLDP
jgi:hypothetical protein